mmetsp:Transcript_28010/g.65465  ORF Transcript_28010/g.65465 Transcript_28010/m.65465 type:complete len:163 (-) Transcript_28010:47-535(-)
MPTLSWGGQGLLGAEVGTGYLHRFPSKTQDTTGASVERKVRYLGTAPSKGGGGDEKKSAETTIELEPQLEMEVAGSESEEGSEPSEGPTPASPPPKPPQSESERMFATPSSSTVRKTTSDVADENQSASDNKQEGEVKPPPAVDGKPSRAAELFAGPPPVVG